MLQGLKVFGARAMNGSVMGNTAVQAGGAREDPNIL